SFGPEALVGRVHLCRPQKQPVERKAPSCGCACHETSACHDRATVRRRLEEAAGGGEATQRTETPLEFFLREMGHTAAAPADRCGLGNSAIRSCRQWLTGFVTGTATMGAGSAARHTPGLPRNR